MRKALCSLGAGTFAGLLDVSSETFRVYAERHGYDLLLHREVLDVTRPPSWSKVRALQEALTRYDVVLWIDADAAIVDASRDVLDEVDRSAVLALVAHQYHAQQIPNCGVMVLRRSRAVRKLLAGMWGLDQYLDHEWWENAALLHLLGYELEPTVRLVKPARVLRRVQFLDPAWNSIHLHESPYPRIKHYPALDLADRLEYLRADLATLRERVG